MVVGLARVKAVGKGNGKVWRCECVWLCYYYWVSIC